MLRNLLFTSLFTCLSIGLSAQQVYFERFIQGIGGTVTDTLDNGTIITLELSTDDAEQENDEVDSYFDDDLDAGWEGAPEDQNLLTLGLRFTGIDVPQGAIIDSAFVVLHAHEGKSAEDVAILNIVAEATDNAITFDEANFNADFLLTDRTSTSASVEWTIAEDWIIWQPYKTADIKAVVQEIVNRPGWVSGNAMAVIFLPTDEQGPTIVENAREFTSFENIADPDDVDPEGNAGDGTNHPERRPYLQVYYQGTIGIAELQSDLFKLYPNPAVNNAVKVELASNSPATAQLVSITGETVRNFDLTQASNLLDLNGLTTGVYLLKIYQDGALGVKRVVIR